MERLYLSRRNIDTLLNKLDSVRDGGSCSCTIIKNDHAHPVFPQTVCRVAVTVVEAGDQYFADVSKRLNISRATLISLLALLEKPAEGKADIGDMAVFAVPDEKYYGDRSDNLTSIGHVSSAFAKITERSSMKKA